MNLYPVSVAPTIILCLLTIFAAASYNQDYLTGDISVNCGSTGTSVAIDGREWHGDMNAEDDSSLQVKGASSSSSVISQLTATADPVPYKTARISRSTFSYAFQVDPSLKLIRLHFNPTRYKGFKVSKDLFTVESRAVILLDNFSPSVVADALGVNTFVKEFCINIEGNQILDIVFTSASSQLQDGMYAFINGIEIISVPKALSYFHGIDLGAQVYRQKAIIYIDNSTALERIYKLNILQDSILPVEDSAEMIEIGATIQTQKRHREKSNTWKISVDVGFRYLVRIHFSKSGLKMAETGHEKFEFLINHMIAYIDSDTRTHGKDNGIILYRNYILVMKGYKQEGKRDLSITLQSRDESIDRERPLKGFEIFKLSNPDNSLACPNQMSTAQNFQSGTPQNLASVLGYSNATAVIFMIVFVNIIVHGSRQLSEKNLTTKENKPLVKGERLCLRFSLDEIRAATQNFNDELVIGRGGFGTVYKGLLNDGGEIVAIKRLRLNSKQGEHEFWREIEALSELRHLNLVSLIGYCNERHEMILVYDYMSGGTLADHLYKKADDSNYSPSLTWNQRLSICIGAGRGLDYLHTGHGIIHRDVKSSNILLDENFVAKVSDFGLAKPETRNMLHSYVSTNVKGTFGYIDPHYFRTRQLTRKSDTYAFGVVLLEVLCGRMALDLRVEEDKHSLTMWAQEQIREGEVEKIISSDLRGDISLDSLKAFVKAVQSCINDEPKRRPTMAQVVLQLEFALKQHESSRQVTDERDVFDVFPYSDEIISSASTENLTITSIDELNISSSSKEQNVIDAKLTSRDRVIRSITKHPRNWQWDVLWKRPKQFLNKHIEDSKSAGQNKLLMKKLVISLLKDYVTGLSATELDWGTMNLATNRFSHSNMMGKGLGGAYYKAVLPTQVIAVKRSSLSEYGHNEFKLEIYLLSKLQHPNLTKLLGYNIHGEEMILAYEFKAETSLHAALFVGRDQLPWTHRFKIIRGIAEGVLYLHQDSELRKFYGDLETQNIILDTEMNPKICFDFKLKPGKDLRMLSLDDKSDHASVECNLGCQISVSTDIHSFGVMVLEIVSGMMHRRSSEEGLDLIAYAWKLWNEEKPLYLMEASTWVSGFSQEEVLRCIRVGLSCTQQQPKYRPMMPLILRSLQGYHELQLELKETVQPKTIQSTSSSIHKCD
ncbi:putative receptor-like protein kinase At5g39000 isoform X2 [Henckelia pumila]|uniref:putative receptor-like protein kinase At5g39000 isoform X2 n=1 Tax=Henckelia pumila TaxID=405737 RepID=UPI003C6E5E19